MGKYGKYIEPITYRPTVSGDIFPSKHEQSTTLTASPKRNTDHPFSPTPTHQSSPYLTSHLSPPSSPQRPISKLAAPSLPPHPQRLPTLPPPKAPASSQTIYTKPSLAETSHWLQLFTYQTILHPDYYENSTRQKIRFVLKTGGLLGLVFGIDRIATIVLAGFDEFTFFEIIVLLIISFVMLYTVEHFEFVLAKENPYQVKEK